MRNDDIKGMASPLTLREQPTKMWAGKMCCEKNVILFGTLYRLNNGHKCDMGFNIASAALNSHITRVTII